MFKVADFLIYCFVNFINFFLSKSNLLSTIIVTNLLKIVNQYKHPRLYFLEHCFLKKWAAFELGWLLKSVLNIFELIRIRFIKFYKGRYPPITFKNNFFLKLSRKVNTFKERKTQKHLHELLREKIFFFNVFLYLFLYLSDITYMIVKKEYEANINVAIRNKSLYLKKNPGFFYLCILYNKKQLLVATLY